MRRSIIFPETDEHRALWSNGWRGQQQQQLAIKKFARYSGLKDDRNYKGAALFPYLKQKRWERRRNEKILALSVSISRRWTRSICSTFPQPSRPAIDRIPGTRSKTSWKNSAGILTAAERGLVEARTIEIKILFVVFFPLILDMLLRLRSWINIIRLRPIFLCCFGIGFFFLHRECEFKEGYKE